MGATVPRQPLAPSLQSGGQRDRGVLLTPCDPEVEEALAIAGKVAGTYRNALRELAK